MLTQLLIHGLSREDANGSWGIAHRGGIHDDQTSAILNRPREGETEGSAVKESQRRSGVCLRLQVSDDQRADSLVRQERVAKAKDERAVHHVVIPATLLVGLVQLVMDA